MHTSLGLSLEREVGSSLWALYSQLGPQPRRWQVPKGRQSHKMEGTWVPEPPHRAEILASYQHYPQIWMRDTNILFFLKKKKKKAIPFCELYFLGKYFSLPSQLHALCEAGFSSHFNSKRHITTKQSHKQVWECSCKMQNNVTLLNTILLLSFWKVIFH